MSDRVELNTSISAAESIKSVGHTKDPRSEEAKRQFAMELDKKLAEEKQKNKKKKDEDEIIIQGDKKQNEDENDKNREEHEHQSSSSQQDGSKKPSQGNTIDLIV